jgi:hypothetical protein
LELKVYVNYLKPSEEQVVFEDAVFGGGFSPQDDSDEEVDHFSPGVGNTGCKCAARGRSLCVRIISYLVHITDDHNLA